MRLCLLALLLALGSLPARALDVTQTAQVSVTVQDAAGHPLPNATVTLTPSDAAQSPPVPLSPDGGGVAEQRIPADKAATDVTWPATLRVTLAGYLPYVEGFYSLFTGAQFERKITLEPSRTTTLHFRDMHGKPLAGVEPRITYQDGPGIDLAATRGQQTDDAGDLVFTHPPLPSSFRVTLGDFHQEYPDRPEVMVAVPTNKMPDVLPAHPLRLTLIAPDGTPAVGWQVASHVRSTGSWGGFSGVISRSGFTEGYSASGLIKADKDGRVLIPQAEDHLAVFSPQGVPFLYPLRRVHPAPTEGGPITTPAGVFASEGRTQFDLAGAQVAGTFADKTPAVTIHPFGKGMAVHFAAEVGRENSSPGGGLQAFLAATLVQQARLAPDVRVAYQGTGFLDASYRRDARGNALIVLTDPTDHAKPLPAATGVTLAPPAPDLTPSVQVFAFPPAQHEGGRVTAGPQPLRVGRDGAGRPTLALPDVASALPVLLARDFPPLLTVSAPETAPAGTDVEVRVTCYNPSPRPLRATLSVVPPASWKSLTAPVLVSVPARGSQTVLQRVRSGGEARAVLKARLDYPLGPHAQGHLESVPVDVYANAPAP